MAVFFVFLILIALCSCYAEIRSLSLTPAMRQRMEERWGMCEVDFAALHVRKNVQSFMDAVGGDGDDSPTTRVARRRNHSVGANEASTGVSEWEEFTAIHWIHQKDSETVISTSSPARKSMHPSTAAPAKVYRFNREEDRMYRKIGKTVTFRSLEALIVGLDYTLCNRIKIQNPDGEKKNHKGQLDQEEEPIILTGSDVDATLDLPSRNLTPELYWEEYPDGGTQPSGAGQSKGKEEGSVNNVPVRRHRHPIQSILDDHPQTWPLYAMEWQPLIMFEVALCVAILLSLVSVLILSRVHELVLPALLTVAVVISAVASITVLYLYSNLFIAVTLAIIGVGISWWWWVYGAPRKALAGVLLRFAGDLFVEKNNSYDSSLVVSPSSPNPSQRVLPNYRRFFIFSLTASAIHILDLTIVMLALMPPFFRFASGERLFFGDILYVLLILVSDYWLLSVVNVVLEYVASGVVLTLYYNGADRRPPATPLKDFLTAACTTHFGAICAHAFCLAPVETIYQIFAFFSPPHGEEESQTSVFGRAAGAVRTWLEQKVCCHFNSFALMHVVMYGCSYDDAAKHTWALMRGEAATTMSTPPAAAAPERHAAVPPPAPRLHRPPFSKVLQHHLASSTMDLSVSVISWASSFAVALATWVSLHVYLQHLHPSVTTNDPIVADFFFDGKDLSKIDWSSIAIALVVLFSAYHIHGHYTVVYRSVWRTLCLCSVECPSGLPCTFPLLYHDVCKSIRQSRTRVLMAELEREEVQEKSDSFLVDFGQAEEQNALLEKASTHWAEVHQYGSTE